MNTRSLSNQAVRYALFTGAAVAAGYTPTAFAANAKAKAPAQLGKVTVTGTRIKRTAIETAQPITRISRQEIQKSGYTNVGELLGQLSSAGAFLNTAANAGGNGAVNIDLRNLGAKRNLVLVNGKRWIPALSGQTNLNTIPTSIIDHIEILQDGASAVYGSDAIAGVINIITLKNFNGAEAHAYYGIRNDHRTGSWDGQIKQYDFTVGTGNDRSNVVFNVTYREQNAVLDGERKISRVPVVGKPPHFGGSSGTPAGVFEFFGPAVSGRTIGQGTCSKYDPQAPTATLCRLTLQKVPAQPSIQNFKDFNPATDSYNYGPTNYGISPGKQVSSYTQGHYDLSDNITFTANADYIRDEATILRAPRPLQVGAFTYVANQGRQIGIAATNPYNPFGVDLVADTTAPCIQDGSCIGLGLLNRRMLESGPRVSDFNRDYFHIFAGFNGYFNLFSREIDWNVGFAQNRVQSTTISTGKFTAPNLSRALGPADQCTAPCVPLNFFGGAKVGDGGSITQAQAHYIGSTRHIDSQTNLRDWTANLSSDVYSLPAGPLGVAIGYERIDNYGYERPDSETQAGLSTLEQEPSLHGRVVRNAEYVELNIPLLADLPGVKDLSVDIANRWAQFKRRGGTEGQDVESFVHDSSGRLNIRYQVNKDLLLRASWAQGFRSPNVSELFGGQTATNEAVSDPCADGIFGGYEPGTPLPPNCPGGTADLQNDSQIHGLSGGNRQLGPESSISRSFGFVYSPSQIPGLDLNADYFKIEITNAVRTLGDANIIDGCFFNSTFCNLITIRGKQVTSIKDVLTNVGSELTEGVDVGLHYKFPSTSFGDFDARINGTFVKTFDVTKVNRLTKTGFATSHLAGITDHPKRRFNGYLDWDYGNWSAQYHIEYFDSVVEPCNMGFSLCTPQLQDNTTDFQGTTGQLSHGRNYEGATVYHDVHVGYTLPAINTTLGLGVQNLFDKKPPISRDNSFHGYNFDLYRPPSRLVYGDIRVKF
jgi:outer membrane receptor protein involved in Fe transport